jgi:hypothetical protein
LASKQLRQSALSWRIFKVLKLLQVPDTLTFGVLHFRISNLIFLGVQNLLPHSTAPRAFRLFPLLVLLSALVGLVATADPLTTVRMTDSTLQASETDGGAVVLVNRTGDLSQAVSVDYLLVPRTATPFADYEEFTGSLTFAPRQTVSGFGIGIIDDAELEGEEQFDVVLSNPSGAVLGSPDTTTITIRDEDGDGGAPEFELEGVTVEEGETATLTVTRGGDLSGAATLSYTTEDGTATGGADYTTATGSVTFPVGAASQTVAVDTLTDTHQEGPEAFTVRLAGPAGVGIGARTTATVTVTDDPADRVQFQFEQPAYFASEETGAATITVTRSGDPDIAASVNYTTSDGTATEAVDYTAASGTLAFAAGETTLSFSVPLLSDTLQEGDETVSLTLSSPQNGDLGTPDSATLTITDDPADQVAFRFSDAVYVGAEGNGPVTVTVERTGDPNVAASVQYSTANGTATEPGDYAAATGLLEFPAGVTTQTFPVTVVDDTAQEGAETVQLALANPQNGVLGTPANALLSITDDADQVSLRFEAPDFSALETAGEATITVRRDGDSSAPATVQYAAADGSASAGADYAATSGLLEFGAGETSRTFPIAILDDTLNEGTETVQLALSDPSGGVIGIPGTALLTITDDAADAGIYHFEQGSYTVAEEGGSATVTVVRDGDNSQPGAVNYSTSEGTASAGADYTPSSGTVQFAAGESVQTFTVPIVDDERQEGPETVQLALAEPTPGVLGSPDAALLTITDAADVVTFQFSSPLYTVAEEAGTATITVTRSGDPSAPASVAYATTDNTAVAGTDYQSAAGVLEFPAGTTSLTFEVPILDDTLQEGNEALHLTLSDPQNGALGTPAEAVLTILEAAGEGAVIGFDAASLQANEAAGLATVTLTRTGNITDLVSTDYSTEALTATAAVDFGPASGTTSFAPGSATATIPVPLIDDNLLEGTERFLIHLAPHGPARLASGDPGTAEIGDDLARPAPQTLQVTLRSSNSAKLAWIDACANETAFVVEQSADEGSSWTTVGTPPAAAGTGVRVVTAALNLAIGNVYQFRVRARNSAALSNPSNSGTISFAPPAAPSDLLAVPVGTTRLQITWRDNASDENGFHLQWSTDGGATWPGSRTMVPQAGTGSTGMFNLTGVNTDLNSYTVRIRAFKDTYVSDWATYTYQPSGAPPAPSDLQLATRSTTQLRLTWLDNAANEDAYSLERSSDGGTTWEWTKITAAIAGSGNRGSYNLSELSPGTTYHYRMRAHLRSLRSPYSALGIGRTWDPLTAPTNVQAQVAGMESGSVLRIRWTDTTISEQGFRVERATTTDFTGSTTFTAPAATGSGAGLSFDDSSYAPDTHYYYRVQAYSGTTTSSWGGPATVYAPVVIPTLRSLVQLPQTAPHNAFTTLCRWNDTWWVAYRDAETHLTFDGEIHILHSTDAVTWTTATVLAGAAGEDLRDPCLSVTPDNRLMLSAPVRTGTDEYYDFQTRAWFSTDGGIWDTGTDIGPAGSALWKVTWNNGTAYSVGYRQHEPLGVTLYHSADGLIWAAVGEPLLTGDYWNEGTLTFDPDGTARCLLRRDTGSKTGVIGTAPAPYTDWTWKDVGARIGGPDMIRMPSGRQLAAVRLYDIRRRTVLAWVDPAAGTLTQFFEVPSESNDNGYPGLVFHDGKLWISYYSSTSGQASVYLASIALPGEE